MQQRTSLAQCGRWGNAAAAHILVTSRLYVSGLAAERTLTGESIESGPLDAVAPASGKSSAADAVIARPSDVDANHAVTETSLFQRVTWRFTDIRDC